MSRHLVVKVERDRAILQGWRGGELAAEAGLRAVYLGTVKGWVVDLARLPDLLAFLQHRGVRVRVESSGDGSS